MTDQNALTGLRPEIVGLPASQIVEIATYGREREGMIPLWFGEGDLPTPDFISDAAIAALRQGHTFYTYQRGIPPLRQALSAYLQGLYDAPVDIDRITVTGSGMQAIQTVAQMLVGPGDEMVIVTPVWPNITAAVQMQGAGVRPVPTALGNDGWQLDLDALFDACGPKTKAIFINSPTNPTGWTLSAGDMLRVRDFVRDRGLWLVADEVYGRFSFGDDGVAPSFLQVMGPEDRLVVVNTFSKNWSMTGWRIGWIVAPPALGPVLENLVQYNTSGTPAFLQYGALAALEKGEDYVGDLVARCRRMRDLVYDRLSVLPRVRIARPDGAFYAFFAVEGEPDSMALARRLVDEAGVGLAPGTAFNKGGEGYLRLCFAASPQRIEPALDRLAPALS
ncbi:MAG: pyridoxal phosphate-dependent aminotransferase [Inquilinaceae bacterium]